MRVLITGVAGFVGSTLAHEFVEAGDVETVGVDDLSFGYRERIEHIAGAIDFREMDVRALPGSPGLGHFDAIVHCAAIAPLPENQADMFRSIEQNVAVCGSVCEFATRTGCRNIVFLSSGAVYEGSDGASPSSETDEIRTRLAYPTSKFLAERLFESVAVSYGLRVAALRLFNLYGPRQDYFRKQPPLLGYLIRCLLQGEVPTIYARPQARRDYLFVDDLQRLLRAILDDLPSRPDGYFTTVNAGTSTTHSVREIIALIGEIEGRDIAYEVGDASRFWSSYPQIFERAIPLRAEVLEQEVDKTAVADISRAREAYGWAPQVSMRDGIARCIEFARTEVRSW